jgi:hypothetical protein
MVTSLGLFALSTSEVVKVLLLDALYCSNCLTTEADMAIEVRTPPDSMMRSLTMAMLVSELASYAMEKAPSAPTEFAAEFSNMLLSLSGFACPLFKLQHLRITKRIRSAFNSHVQTCSSEA